ncbi:MAG: bifunctional phosphoglucose/phosphomannose isomerase [Patescibacteria group bacterium]
MTLLDDLTKIKTLDKSHVAQSIGNLPDQLWQAWEGTKNIVLPANYNGFNNIVFAAMGGSNLASELARSIYSKNIRVPYVLIRDYNLPAFVDRQTLVIIDSYSGTTEETLNCFKIARHKKAKIICISSGNTLIKLAKKNRVPYYQIDDSLNPSDQPRYDVGSQLGATLGILNKLKVISVKSHELKEATDYLKNLNRAINPSAPQTNNLAKKIAQEIKNKFVVIVGAEHLSANGHILANQLNESAKNLAVSFKIPELNHHLLEGLSFPSTVIAKTIFVFLDSSLYAPNIAKRFAITQKILSKQKINSLVISARGQNNLISALETASFGGWVSFYLAMINGQNPASIPYVNYFKTELKK